MTRTTISVAVAAVFCFAVGAIDVVAQQPPAGGAQPPAPRSQLATARRFVLRAGHDVTPSFVRPLRPNLGTGAHLATIIVTYHGSRPPAAEAAFQAAVNVWASLLTSSVPISIDATFAPLGTGVLGQAGPDNFFADFAGAIPNTWYPVALANKLAGSDLDPGFPDIDAEFSSDFNWYYGTDGMAPPGTYDFMTVVLHEIGHGLGFLGFMSYDFSSAQGMWGLGSGLPAVYDRFTENLAGQSLINTSLFPNPSVALGNQLKSNNLFFDGPNERAANSGNRAKIYAPSTWSDGSSYSHLDEAIYGVGNSNSLMTPILNFQEAIHDPGPITRGIFADSGWTLSSPCSYGLSPTAFSTGAGAASSSATVTTAAGCAWTAVSNNLSFLTVTGGSSGAGSGTVSFSVASNVSTNTPTSTRVGTLAIAGQTFTVTQTGCTYGIDPTGITFASSAGSGAVTVAAPGACTWTVTGLPAWIATTSGSSGTGAGSWQYTVAANGTLATRSQTVLVAGLPFGVTQLSKPLKSLVPGTGSTFTLNSATDERWMDILAVGRRSYCAFVAAGRTAVDRSTPTLAAFRADTSGLPLRASLLADTTPMPSASSTGTSVCFVAPATETALFRVRQTEGLPRSYRLVVVETTLWSSWFFIGGSYSSYTMLRNTLPNDIHATVTWRSDAGTVVGTESVTIPPDGVYYRDARATTTGAIAGSVEVAHDGPPQGLIGAQTTLSAMTGLSFDAVMKQRLPQ